MSLNATEKLEIAQQLARLGVDVIEAGFPIASPGDFQAVQKIAQEVHGPVIAASHARKRRTSSAPPRQSATPSTRASTRSSRRRDIHIQHQLQSTREDVLGRPAPPSRRPAGWSTTSSSARWTPPAPTSSSPPRCSQAALEEGATTINVPDTVGYRSAGVRRFLTRLHELVPGLRDVILSVHCHDDLGLAVANSFAGLRRARQVECAINGIGERAGNTSLEEIVMLPATSGPTSASRRASTRARSPAAAGSSAASRATACSPTRRSSAVTPSQHESGIHQDGVLKERSTYEIMSAEFPSAWTRRTRSCSASTPAATRCSRR